MFDLIMFDLDGTLVDSVLEIADATNAVLRDRGYQAARDAQIHDWIGNGARETVVQALADASSQNADTLRADHDDIDAAMECFAQAYMQCCGQRSELFPHVVDTLQVLRDAGMPMALVTNKENRLTQRVLALQGLRKFFDPTLSGDSLARRKPDPLPLQHCMDVHGVTPERALMVGDSPVDVAAARNAGAACWAVPYGYSRGRPIAEWEPDRVLTDFRDMLDVVADGKTGIAQTAVRVV